MESAAPPSRAALIHMGCGHQDPKGCTQGVNLPGRPPWGHPRRGPWPRALRGRPECSTPPPWGLLFPSPSPPSTHLSPGRADRKGSDPEQGYSQQTRADWPRTPQEGQENSSWTDGGRCPQRSPVFTRGGCKCEFTSPSREAWGDI